VVPRALPRRARATVAGVAVGLVLASSLLAWSSAAADQVRNAQWWLRTLHVTRAWDSSRGADVKVALLDTGVDTSQPDLTGVVTSGPDFTGSGRSPSGPFWGIHGTAMASLIAGHGHGAGNADGIIGVAPAARILSVRVTLEGNDPLLKNPTVATALPGAIARGIRYAVKHGASVIDLPLDPVTTPGSAGAGGSTAERSAVSYALAHHVVLVAPAGDNGAGSGTPNYPAAYPGVISVGAFSRSFVKAPFSSRQPYVTVTGPGQGVMAANGTQGYAPLDSTSAASAVVTGIVALIQRLFPALTPAEVTKAITSSTVYRRPGGRRIGSGYGTVDAATALMAATRMVESVAGKGAPGGIHQAPPSPPAVHVPPSHLRRTLLTDAIIAGMVFAVMLIAIFAIGWLRRGRARSARLAEVRAAAIPVPRPAEPPAPAAGPPDFMMGTAARGTPGPLAGLPERGGIGAAEWTAGHAGQRETARTSDSTAFPGTAFPGTAFPGTAFPGTAFPGTAFPRSPFTESIAAGSRPGVAGDILRPLEAEGGAEPAGTVRQPGSQRSGPARVPRVTGRPPWEPAPEPDSELPWSQSAARKPVVPATSRALPQRRTPRPGPGPSWDAIAEEAWPGGPRTAQPHPPAPAIADPLAPTSGEGDQTERSSQPIYVWKPAGAGGGSRPAVAARASRGTPPWEIGQASPPGLPAGEGPGGHAPEDNGASFGPLRTPRTAGSQDTPATAGGEDTQVMPAAGRDDTAPFRLRRPGMSGLGSGASGSGTGASGVGSGGLAPGASGFGSAAGNFPATRTGEGRGVFSSPAEAIPAATVPAGDGPTPDISAAGPLAEDSPAGAHSPAGDITGGFYPSPTVGNATEAGSGLAGGSPTGEGAPWDSGFAASGPGFPYGSRFRASAGFPASTGFRSGEDRSGAGEEESGFGPGERGGLPEGGAAGNEDSGGVTYDGGFGAGTSGAGSGFGADTATGSGFGAGPAGGFQPDPDSDTGSWSRPGGIRHVSAGLGGIGLTSNRAGGSGGGRDADHAPGSANPAGSAGASRSAGLGGSASHTGGGPAWVPGAGDIGRPAGGGSRAGAPRAAGYGSSPVGDDISPFRVPASGEGPGRFRAPAPADDGTGALPAPRTGEGRQPSTDSTQEFRASLPGRSSGTGYGESTETFPAVPDADTP
jgi:subtilase family protein